MEIFDNIEALDALSVTRAVYTVGNFDGVHLGHMELLRVCRSAADETGSKFVVITFSRHPKDLFHPEHPVDKITGIALRRELIAETAPDYLVELDFNWELASLEAEPFLDMLCRNRERVDFFVGNDFNFGSKKRGNRAFIAEYLKKRGLGLLHIVPSVVKLSHKVSSTSIRRKIRVGKVADAARLLGRFYCLKGETAPGQQLGRQLGFPTLNMAFWQTVLPENGVYATFCLLHGVRYQAVTYVGIKPTFDESRQVVETHLLSVDPGVVPYGSSLEVDFVCRIRGDRRFEDVSALVAQMRDDVKQADLILKKKL